MARPYRPRRWRAALPDPAGCQGLVRNLNISVVTAQVLWNRGFCTAGEAAAFLNAGRDQLHDPFLLAGMDRAVDVLTAAVRERRPVMVYGDYDVDGVTGTAILVTCLRSLGALVEYYIPNRFSEGYGLNAAAIESIARRGFDLILSVDTGTSALQEAQFARSLGVTLVITDHHEPGPELPDAAAVVNPKRADCQYPFKGLSGVGVAFKLALALEAPAAWECLDIVTLGTIADMVPLVGENRAIVKEGLAGLRQTGRPGLQALMEVAGLSPDREVSASHVGFALGPRINALGRMGDASLGVELLLTQDSDRAMELARRLDEENKNRQEVEAAIVQEAMAQAEAYAGQCAMVLAAEGWHPGVVGICASRVLEAYHRPTILLSIEGETAKGSARSIPGFHLYKALYECRDLLQRFGGHAMAAGMTLPTANIPLLRARMEEIARETLDEEALTPHLAIDAWIDAADVHEGLARELAVLEPHGIGNPEPLLAMQDAGVVDVRTMGREGQHLRMRVRGTGISSLEAVAFNLAQIAPAARSIVHLAFRPEMNVWNGRESLQLRVKDLQEEAGLPSNVARVPEVGWEGYLAWDPLDGLSVRESALPADLVDARGQRLAERLLALRGEMEDAGEGAVTRAAYAADLAVLTGRRALVLTSSPWAAGAAAASLSELLPRQGVQLWAPGSPPPPAQVAVAAWGGFVPEAAANFDEILLFHPPYTPGQMTGLKGRVHLAWAASDWALSETALVWPYPDRETLVHLYRILRESGPTATPALAGAMAAAGREPAGLWSRLRVEAGLAIFVELGIAEPFGGGQVRLKARTGRFQLEQSRRYRKGMQGREALAACRQLFEDGALTYNREYKESI